MLLHWRGRRLQFTPTMFSIAFLAFAGIAEGLNHGRDALKGEFPYVVRVKISDLEDDAERIAAGVLITLSRVLTTCDTVGYFTGETVNLHVLSRVTLLAGTIYRDGNGQKRKPTSSSYHPWCHLLASEMVLFNLGFFVVEDPGFTATEYLKPMPQAFTSRSEALEASYQLYQIKAQIVCYAAGWGYPTMAFEDQVEPDFFNSSSEVLQVAKMTVVPYEGEHGCLATTCKEFGDCLVNIWEYGLVCATAKRGGPCRNDMGAPLMCAGGIFTGVHTNPQRCEEKGIPRHFIRTDLVYNYIYDLKSAAISISANTLLLLGTALLLGNRATDGSERMSSGT